jgi:uncharacterized protein
MNEQQNIEAVKQAYEAFGTGDMPTLLGMFDENIEWRTPDVEGSPFQSAYDGREAVAEFFKTIDEHENFSQFEPREFIAQGDRVVVLGALTSTVNSTGRNYQTEWVHFFTMRDGKITNFKEFFDTAAASKAFQKAANA